MYKFHKTIYWFVMGHEIQYGRQTHDITIWTRHNRKVGPFNPVEILIAIVMVFIILMLIWQATIRPFFNR